ncbi:MAG: hypothetical protein ACOY0T_36920 [Myxococcota bacterium]
MQANLFRSLILCLLPFALAAGCGGDDDQRNGNPSGVGNHCARDSDCPTGTCYLGPGGGYCTSPCSDEGSVSQCPLDTICKPIQGGPARCLLICGSDTSCADATSCRTEYCPSGSSCVSVSNNTLKGCEPNPG